MAPQVTTPREEAYQQLAPPVAAALETTGFIYLRNHGLQGRVVEEAMATSMEFFHLPEEVKAGISKGPEYQGWVAQGREVFDQDEGGNIAELEVRGQGSVQSVME